MVASNYSSPFLNSLNLILGKSEFSKQQVVNLIEDELRKSLEAIDKNTSALTDYLFFKSLKRRVTENGHIEDHIYLKKFEVPQIVLFDLLINQFPLVRMAHELVNHTIVSHLTRVKKLVLIDVGIGRGIQVANLLRALKAKEDSSIEEVNIIGIDASDEFDHAKQLIDIACAGAKFRIRFTPINSMVESLSVDNVKKHLPKREATIVVNASLCLHHIQSTQDRVAFFTKMKQLNPDLFFLIEPNSDHQTSQVEERIRNAYEHYGTVFKIIDELNIQSNEKNSLKMFFEREIEDVVAYPDEGRFERHQPSAKWQEYLTNSNFTLLKQFVIPELKNGPVFTRIDENGFACLTYKGIDMLSIFMAR